MVTSALGVVDMRTHRAMAALTAFPGLALVALSIGAVHREISAALWGATLVALIVAPLSRIAVVRCHGGELRVGGIALLGARTVPLGSARIVETRRLGIPHWSIYNGDELVAAIYPGQRLVKLAAEGGLALLPKTLVTPRFLVATANAYRRLARCGPVRSPGEKRVLQASGECPIRC